MKKLIYLLSILPFLGQSVFAEEFNTDVKAAFIDEMVNEHDFNRAELTALLGKAVLLDNVLESISRPAEKSKEWFEYRPIFMTEKRTKKGVEFWQEHLDILLAAEQQYGVAREVIVAIIGVETYYGLYKGKYRVLDSLSTLGFNYPPRAEFFRKQLREFLLFTRRLNIDPTSLMGSYAGAMGMPQFIPSSFQSYAVDFDNDGQINIWDNPADIIGSVANYFKEHRWQAGEPVAIPAWVKAGVDQTSLDIYLDKGLKPTIPLADLRQDVLTLKRDVPGNPDSALLKFRQKNDDEYWVGFQNFYTITRYNHSPMYALAVFQLSQAVREAYIAQALKK
jgi:membrane-bound lytic murein transglycosylase B